MAHLLQEPDRVRTACLGRMRGRHAVFHRAPTCVVKPNGSHRSASNPILALRAAFASPCSLDLWYRRRAPLLACATNGSDARQMNSPPLYHDPRHFLPSILNWRIYRDLTARQLPIRPKKLGDCWAKSQLRVQRNAWFGALNPAAAIARFAC
jgi:hypothetical protein